ncbi:hypothetical protein QU481_09420 [Crenobacter sp. SG2303]|uniref:Uncharacterized protein n=1 Tax=Crenobacter oryzisoli TaxID=3056844 RepID=A0ABT7XMS5_9NEIS|nr:hypothetical protein [Crenobacter sp. SG2303]MDN0075108.1 hypothetical protein [Crenobacter sp. SG2303]
MKNALLISLLAISPLCLAESVPTPVTAVTAPSQSIMFLDSKLFDGRLYNELSKQPDSLEITMPGRVALTNMSPRLDRWLSIIGENGQMALQEVPEPAQLNQRALFALLPILYTMVGEAKEAMVNAQAKRYNATLFYFKDSNGNAVINRVILTKKP